MIYSGGTVLDSFSWINEPTRWQHQNGILHVVTDEKTDFWHQTWYGFERFSGHIFARAVQEDFTFQVKIRADFTTLYDQAGLMLMRDAQHWLKAGIEYNDGAPAIGSVLTLGQSDWATGIFPGDARAFWLRLTRKGDSLRLQYSTDGQCWPLLRLCPFPPGRVNVGVMCCTPERAGLAVAFEDISLSPPLDKALHDLS
jgi:regulation of enolase protein 1 (concanavalin A-like superfamily)